MMFKKIGLALAFSPTCKALLAEAVRVKHLFQSELVLIHIGLKDEGKIAYLDSLLKSAGLTKDTVKVIWKQGKPAKTIIKICEQEKIELLIAGAMRHENLIKYYVGSIARKILRKAPCSVLILTEPSVKPTRFKEIVIDAEDTLIKEQVYQIGLQIGKLENSRLIHFVKEVKLYGLAMSVISESSIKEFSLMRNNLIAKVLDKVEKELSGYDTDGLRINIKVIAGKSGFELRKFTRQIKADLLVVGAVHKKLNFFSRIYQHDLEFIFEDIPGNLLVVKTINNPDE